MKRFSKPFRQRLLAGLLCLGMLLMSSCATPVKEPVGQQQSSANTGSTSRSSAPSSRRSSSADISSRTPVSSRPAVSSTPADEEGEKENLFPDIPPVLEEFYDQNPKIKEYYETYLVPYHTVATHGLWTNWHTAEDIWLPILLIWYGQHISDQKWQSLPWYDAYQRMVPADRFEQTIEEHFAIDASVYRQENSDGCYHKEQDAYTWAPLCPDVRRVCSMLIRVEELPDRLDLIVRRVLEKNVESITIPPENEEEYYPEKWFRLTVLLESDGSFRYASCEEIPPEL